MKVEYPLASDPAPAPTPKALTPTQITYRAFQAADRERNDCRVLLEEAAEAYARALSKAKLTKVAYLAALEEENQS